jgi:hypothetical protein
MTAYRATKKTEAKWAERVRAWRASGETAQEYAVRHGFAASTLHVWSSRLQSTEAPRFLRLVPKTTDSPPSPEVVVEVGGARVRVGAGFDRALLADVVRALVGGPR